MNFSNKPCSEDNSDELYQKHRQDSDDDDDMSLSENALRALQEFYQEKELKDCPDADTVDLVEENWELSQFWYDKNTALILRDVALKAAGETGRIACISCPTVYAYLVDVISIQRDNLYLFEYDKRFKELYMDHCIFYNYNEPLMVPEIFNSYFDLVLVDPPYLSQECLEKTLETVKLLSKDKIILCTGAVMEEFANELLSLRPCNFKPQHERKLGNEFKCYANFNLDDLVNEINLANSS